MTISFTFGMAIGVGSGDSLSLFMELSIVESLLFISIFLSFQCVFADTLDDLNFPKKPAYRLGVSYDIEKEYKVTDITQRKESKTASYEKQYIKNSTYALKNACNNLCSSWFATP